MVCIAELRKNGSFCEKKMKSAKGIFLNFSRLFAEKKSVQYKKGHMKLHIFERDVG